MKLNIRIIVLMMFIGANAWTAEVDTAFFGNIINKLNIYNEKFPSEKVYVQLDKYIYNAGEIVWFKAYITEMQKNRPSFLSRGLFIKLFNQTGKAIVEEKFMIENGIVCGDFTLPKDLNDGFYALTAYSSWMENDSIDRVYRKFIEISNSKSSEYSISFLSPPNYYLAGQTLRCEVLLMTPDERSIEGQKIKYSLSDGSKNIFKSDTRTDKSGKAILESFIPIDLKKKPLFIICEARVEKNTIFNTRIFYPQPEKLNIGFFPEGGYIIGGVKKIVVVNATDMYGNPVVTEGEISDKNGRIITYFSTSLSGYGKFQITAQPKTILQAKITNPSGIDQVFQLPEMKENGISIALLKKQNDTIIFLIETGKNDEAIDLKCLLQANGNLFWAGFVTIKKAGILKIPVRNLYSGVTQFIAFDKNNNVVLQRLIISENENKASIVAKTDALEYATRSKVKVKIKVKNFRLSNNNLSLSFTVCKSSLFDSLKNIGINNSFQINPELEKSLCGSTTGEKDDLKKSLDFFLIANNYRRFTWEKIINLLPETQGFISKDGLSGLVLDHKGKPVINANVSIINPSTFKLIRTTTDNYGWFEAPIIVPDCNENSYSITAISKDGNKKNEVLLADRFSEDLKLFATTDPTFINPVYNYLRDTIRQNKLNEIFINQAFKEIKNRKKEIDDEKFKEIKKSHLLSPNKSLLDIIAEIKPYQIVNNKIIFSGCLNSIMAQTGARFVVDGVLGSDDISSANNINVSDIEDIKIITDPNEILRYTPFANGIIEITTKKGGITVQKNPTFDKVSNNGYKITRKFSAPDYSNEEVVGKDYRTTLLWEPAIKVNNEGEAEVLFYNSDIKGSFTGNIEGLINGEPVSVRFSYYVK